MKFYYPFAGLLVAASSMQFPARCADTPAVAPGAATETKEAKPATPADKEGGAIVGGWQLTVRAAKSEFKAGEPIVLHVAMHNTTDKSLETSNTNFAEAFKFVIKNEKGKEVELTGEGKEYYTAKDKPGQIVASSADTKIQLTMGSRYNISFPIKAGGEVSGDVLVNRLYELAEPGVYTISVQTEPTVSAKPDPVKTETPNRATVNSNLLHVKITDIGAATPAQDIKSWPIVTNWRQDRTPIDYRKLGTNINF